MLPAPHRPFVRLAKLGNAVLPILVIVVALAISAAVFFLFTKRNINAKQEAMEAQATEQAELKAKSEAAEKEAATKAPSPDAGQTAAAKPAASPTAPVQMAKPVDAGRKLAELLAKGDKEGAARMLAASDPAQAKQVQDMLEKLEAMGYQASPVDAVKLLGQSGNAVRVEIPLLSKEGAPTDQRLLLDVVMDAKTGWRIDGLRLPKALEQVVPVDLPAGGTKPLMVVEASPDALTFAADFVTALLKSDYDTVRLLVDEQRVPPVKLAGLCIVFEESQYVLDPQRPLVSTVTTETSSWIIAKLQSADGKVRTEFGLEMEKTKDGWLVAGLNLSQLLADNSKTNNTGDVPYVPLVKNPRGGESVALYFEYDSDVLHPRAQAQLRIVAGMLKASPTRKLKIGGYTDAKGSSNYNLQLSNRRAEAVKQFFLGEQVPLKQVETVGFGASNPLKPNLNPDGTDNPEGRSVNRRAEILLDF